MTVIFGTLRDVGGQLAQGTVTVSSLVTRPAHGSASTVITKERHVLPLRNGAFESPELDPGPVRVEATTGGAFESWQVLLPEDGRHDLATLIETHVDYNPSVVGRVEAAAADANRAAQAAGQSATRAADAEHRVSLVVASAADVVRGELQVQIDGATQARVDAQAAQAAAEAAASTVVDDARTQVAALVDELEVSFSDAQELVATASGHAEASAGHAESAAGSAAEARESADAADAAAAVVGGAVEGAEESAREAAASAADAAGAVSVARGVVDEVQQAGQSAVTLVQGHVTAAEAHATAAGSARAGAESARDEAVAAAESAQTGAPVGGWQRATLHQDVQDSLSRADSAMQSMPRATSTAPGGVQLAGDLGGTADAPTVPGLTGKLSVSEVSESATGQSVPRRTQAGTIRVAAPTSDDDAATKQYVDNQVATAVPPTVGPSEEEMTILWEAVQRQDPIEINLASNPQGSLWNALTARGLDYRTITHPAFSVSLTGTGPASYLFKNWARMKRAPVVTGGGGVTSMSEMFYGCASLTSVPALDTSQVTSMSEMFYGCASLTTLPSLDCSALTSGFSAFRTFRGCVRLESVTLPGMGGGFTTKQDLDMKDTKLNAAAANALMQSLGTIPAAATGSTLQLPATATGADVSIATAKNWTVTIG